MENYLHSCLKILLLISSLSAIVLWKYNYLPLDRIYSFKNIHQNNVSRKQSTEVNGILHQNNNMVNGSFRILPKCAFDLKCKPPSKWQDIQWI